MKKIRVDRGAGCRWVRICCLLADGRSRSIGRWRTNLPSLEVWTLSPLRFWLHSQSSMAQSPGVFRNWSRDKGSCWSLSTRAPYSRRSWNRSRGSKMCVLCCFPQNFWRIWLKAAPAISLLEGCRWKNWCFYPSGTGPGISGISRNGLYCRAQIYCTRRLSSGRRRWWGGCTCCCSFLLKIRSWRCGCSRGGRSRQWSGGWLSPARNIWYRTSSCGRGRDWYISVR